MAWKTRDDIFGRRVGSHYLVPPVSSVNPEGPAINLKTIQIPHGILSRVGVLVLAEAKTLGPACLTVLDNPAQ